MVSAKKVVMESHVESKHSGKMKKTFEECFPDFGKVKVTAVKANAPNKKKTDDKKVKVTAVKANAPNKKKT